MALVRLATFTSVLGLAGSAWSLDDPVHFGGNVEILASECVPSTTTETVVSTLAVTVTVSVVDNAYGDLESSTPEPSTLPPLTLTNTNTLTTTTFRTQTAYSGLASTSDCITVTVTSKFPAYKQEVEMLTLTNQIPFVHLQAPGATLAPLTAPASP
ncbi:uncharacterized protein B0I36DRAFT_344507 [Microdochium trichocladiopsis]|uniref:Uncharacterized protein n=1 Tax=Microdochium trichocladiopsis TaxID=1682393 RepID=A0A9P9BWQ6_9PEZI|nr:uncharacterized protein B0I36DRAFT_344507 [Microdochium trichocladiopsis]KAH7040830.1 hypothetical protein B0I36DRAFT_344507 [Microdochium trichocladiopsis]